MSKNTIRVVETETFFWQLANGQSKIAFCPDGKSWNSCWRLQNNGRESISWLVNQTTDVVQLTFLQSHRQCL